eukprot:12818121-Alexandrium_andersonii.AAC.1
MPTQRVVTTAAGRLAICNLIACRRLCKLPPPATVIRLLGVACRLATFAIVCKCCRQPARSWFASSTRVAHFRRFAVGGLQWTHGNLQD